MITVIKPPQKFSSSERGTSLFLGGSIEMGKAEKWQDKVIEYLKAMNSLQDKNVIVLNPRRDDWDSSWVQSITNPQFKEQVEWELRAQEWADIIGIYFLPGTKSPISLLELGLFAQGGKVIVCCPQGFWRKGNVDIVCEHYDVKKVETFEDFLAELYFIFSKVVRS